ncbi:hypothetical protein FBQ99_22295 [Chloroflexi bacterium CFX2]|nr:hypothetical protein [Chloroflexi bacterium CFX2]
MKGSKKSRGMERYIAVDIHKEYVLVGGQNAAQEWVMAPRRIEMAKFREWARANLHEGDEAALETTTNVWDIYDTVALLASRTLVAHARAVRRCEACRSAGQDRQGGCQTSDPPAGVPRTSSSAAFISTKSNGSISRVLIKFKVRSPFCGGFPLDNNIPT